MKRYLTHFFRYQVPAVVWAGIIFWLSAFPSHKLPRFTHLFNDKFIHAATFFILGLLIYRALEPIVNPKPIQWKRLVTSVIIVVIYGFIDEFHQAFVPGRSIDIKDAAADTIGGILAAFVIYLFAYRKHSTS